MELYWRLSYAELALSLIEQRAAKLSSSELAENALLGCLRPGTPHRCCTNTTDSGSLACCLPNMEHQKAH